MLKLAFYGAARTVTGSCFLVEAGDTRVLVDCGMFQGTREIRERNYRDFPFRPGDIDFVLLTHAHIDHSGLIPKLFLGGYDGPVVATHGTADLCGILLPDSGHIQEMEVERKNRKARRAGKPLLQPIYTARDAFACLPNFRPVRYREVVTLTPNIKVRFREAGHILGSALIEMWVGEVKIVFTGDLGGPGHPIVRDPAIVGSADYVVMESTYGDRLQRDTEDVEAQLAEVIKETFARGGNLIIPAFAVERTQDLLLALNNLIEAGEIRARDVYIDSPLAISATEIFCRHPEYYDEETTALMEATGACPLHLPGLRYARTTEESMALNEIKGGAIIISASGMCDAGRIKHHLKHNLWRPECTILFVGYQAHGTLGRRILDGAKTVRIHGEEIVVRAAIRKIEGFSSHADQAELLAWLGSLQGPPAQVFLVHGEEEAQKVLAELIGRELGFPVEVPQYGQVFELQATGRSHPVQPEVPLGPYRALAAHYRVGQLLAALSPGQEDREEVRKALKHLQSAAALLESVVEGPVAAAAGDEVRAKGY